MTLLSPIPVQERLQYTLSNPSLLAKIQEISNLLQEVSSKDGASVIRLIVENMFGISSETQSSMSSSMQQSQQLGEGWGIRIITLNEHYSEFQAIRSFLSPNGPFLNFIYRLSQDSYQLVPFPISLFPAKLRSQFESGTASQFYSSKVQSAGPGKMPTNVLFNPFEYYMFHFGFFVVGLRSPNWNILWTSVKDSLYPTLLEDYLSAYLPCNAAFPPGPSAVPLSPRGLLSPVSHRQVGGSFHGGQPQPNISLLVSPIGPPHRFNEYTLDTNSLGYQTSSPIHSTVASQSEGSAWTSQVLVQVLMEVWVNFCIPVADTMSGPYSSMNAPSSQLPCAPSNPTLVSQMEDVFVPSADHVRAVRMVVKHFHYFSNSVKSHYPSPLDSLRKNILPMCRKGMYLFLKHLFIHWPLDSSFRIALETWLSYIQPWRYLSYVKADSSSDALESEAPKVVDLKWTGYLAQNLLFYTHFFGLVVRRLLKLDLTSLKNAQILYRLAKVFAQENFSTLVQEIEDLIEANQGHKGFGALVGGFISTPHTSSPPGEGSEGQLLPQHLVQIVRSHILEVESQNHVYMPFFAPASLKDVFQLIQVAISAQGCLKAELALIAGAKASGATKTESAGWIASVFGAFFDASQKQEEENSREEMRKCVSHLDISVNYFCTTFNISVPKLPDPSSDESVRFLGNVNLNEASGTPEKIRVPEQVHTTDGPKLTEFGRRQLMNGLRRMDLKYEGDPDLRPISDFEVGFFVRGLYAISQRINQKYGSKFEELHGCHSFRGSLSRLFLQPPQTVYKLQRTTGDTEFSSLKVPVNLPPRLSLRKFAQKKLILYVFLLYLLFGLFGVSFSRTTFQLVVPFLLTYFLIKAALGNTLRGQQS